MVSTRTEDLKRQLRDAGLRATSARLAVLRCLMAATGPLSHAEVCERLVDAGLDRATLYRNLVDLTEVGIARRTDHGDHVWRFELAGGGPVPEHQAHPHFVCSECGDVACLPDGAVEVTPVRGSPRALRRKGLEVQLRGRCDSCS